MDENQENMADIAQWFYLSNEYCLIAAGLYNGPLRVTF
jgi:hypothetical protein